MTEPPQLGPSGTQTEIMPVERFAELVGIYGSRIDRWPSASRDAAHRRAATEEGRAILMKAIELDVVLDSYVVPPPTAALVGRVIAAIPRRDQANARIRRWLEGLGFFGAGLAGVIAGSLAMSVVQPGPSPETDVYFDQPTTVFGDVGRMTSSSEEAQ